jgi:hypothetical protein
VAQQAADRGEHDEEAGLGVEQGEEDEHPDRGPDRPGQVDGAPPVAVGEVPEPRDQEQLEGRADQHGVEGGAARQVELLDHVHEDEQGEGVEGDVDPEPGPERGQDRPGVHLQHVHDRGPGLGVVVLQLLEPRGLGDGHPDPQADGDQGAAEQERDPPAPRLEGGVRQGGRHDGEHGPAPLAAQSQPLDDPEHDQQDGRGHADGRIGRQQAVRKVAMPITSSVTTSTVLRPSLSPSWPKTIPPMGRARNPVAEVVKASRVPVSGSASGKNSLLKTRPAAEA